VTVVADFPAHRLGPCCGTIKSMRPCGCGSLAAALRVSLESAAAEFRAHDPESAPPGFDLSRKPGVR
jgi:hypothetical protein